jgi:hypothetical protein
MAERCEMELCPNWAGDDGCPCAVLHLERPTIPISTLTGRPCTGHPVDERCIECVDDDQKVTIDDGYVHFGRGDKP